MNQDRRIQAGINRGAPFTIQVDGRAVRAYPGETIGSAMVAAGLTTCRHTPVAGAPRGLYCGMGICHDCLVTVDGRPNLRACQTPATAGAQVSRPRGRGRYENSAPEIGPTRLVQKKAPLVVVGAGPAGLSAAIQAARLGARVVVIDENPRPGGQIYRQVPAEFQPVDPAALGEDYVEGRSLLDQVEQLGDRIEVWTEALVWAVFEQRQLAVMRGDDLVLLDAEKVVIATGAYDRPVPVPGWTLPGVMTAGGAQILLKSQRVQPGRRVLLAGTGPLQLVLAGQLLEAGTEVVAVAEAAGRFDLLRRAPALLRQIGLLRQGLGHLRRLRRAGVPLLRSYVIESIHGRERVERAVLCEVDGDWRRREGTTRSFEVDTVCLGYGFVPHTWMTGLMGCTHRYDPLQGGWVPQFDDRMQTDKPGVFVAGDGAGVAGALVAVEEGRLAGTFAAAQLGVISEDEAGKRAGPPRRRLGELRKFRRALDEVSMIRRGLYAGIPDDTVICRCEEVTAGTIRQAVRRGTPHLSDIKKRTRAGMGYCQGANCVPAIAAMLSGEFGVAPEAVTAMTPRPPARPIPLSLLLVKAGAI